MRRDRITPTGALLVLFLAVSTYAQTPRTAAEPGESVEPTGAFHEFAAQALSLSRHGQGDKALDLARRAEQLARRATLPKIGATVNGWNQVGIVYFENGYLKEAKNAYESGLTLGKEVLPSADVLFGDLHNNLGNVEFLMKHPNAARDHLEVAVRIKTLHQPQTRSLAVSLDNLGVAMERLDDLEKAEEMHNQALEIFLSQNNPRDAATAWNNLGRVYLRKRDYPAAERYLRKSLATHKKFGLEDPGTLTSATNLVRLYLHWGDERRSDDLINYLVTIGGASPSPRHKLVANVCKELASEAFNLGRLGLAERFATRAVELYKAVAGPVSYETLDAKFLLAMVLARKGNFAAAEDIWVHLLNVYGVNEKAKLAQVEIELGKVFLNRGREGRPVAKKMFEAAISDLRGLSPIDEEELASALGNLGLLFFHDAELQLAQEKYAEALGLLENKEGSKERPWLLYNQAQLLYHIGAYDKARAGYEKAKALWAKALPPDHPFIGTAAANVALVYWIQGDEDRALRAFEEASAIEERGMQRDMTIGTESERVAYARAMQDNLYKVFSFCFHNGPCGGGKARLAATLLLQRKARALDAMAQTMVDIRENLEPEDRKLLDRLDMIRSEIGARATHLPAERAKAEDRATLQQLKDEEDRLQSALSYKSALVRARLRPVSLETVANELGGNAVLVEYLKYSVFEPNRGIEGNPWRSDRYAALVLRSQRDPQLFDLGSAELIDKRVETLRDKLEYPGGGRDIIWLGKPPEDFHDDASELYQLVVAPIRRTLDDAKLLIIAPDGALNLIPFGVLGDLCGKRISDVFVVNYLYSGRELLREKVGMPVQPTIVVMANPDFDAEAGTDSGLTPTHIASRGSFKALPGTLGEATAIKALFESATVLDGPKATVAALKGVSRPAILHVATHGFFDPLEDTRPEWKQQIVPLGGEAHLVHRVVPSALENPMLYSGLALAGANRAAHSGQYGIISAFEIASLDLRGTQLVVLSACRTGVGIIKRGEEFAGLRRAISIAGAASQVISLWKVDDEATRALMTEYYRLLVERRGRAEALQLAQQHIERDSRWSHPKYWAAFVPSGDSTPMSNILEKVGR